MHCCQLIPHLKYISASLQYITLCCTSVIGGNFHPYAFFFFFFIFCFSVLQFVQVTIFIGGIRKKKKKETVGSVNQDPSLIPLFMSYQDAWGQRIFIKYIFQLFAIAVGLNKTSLLKNSVIFQFGIVSLQKLWYDFIINRITPVEIASKIFLTMDDAIH